MRGPPTGRRDLRDPNALGVLVASGRTRARTYGAGPAFPESVLETARTPTLLVDPYRQ
ncbi:hypothetical protein [Kineosporia sp. NBRC 101677]|uniref:hypothetical protein n=1 Tax=Kineosporia sp. NBRC 101677 TaxID=3032197 RepID=UPI0025543000|nr:hypothetical protein [Kineosporia sp. NBRC 101677]